MARSGFVAGIILILGALLVASGCARLDESLSTTGNLTTTIRPDGSKQFVYRIPPRLLREDMAISHEERQVRNSHANDGGFNGRAMNPEESGVGRRKEDTERFLGEQARRKLLVSGYCRSDKFITIRINTDPLDTYLQGECQESATDDDRKKFPSTGTR